MKTNEEALNGFIEDCAFCEILKGDPNCNECTNKVDINAIEKQIKAISELERMRDVVKSEMSEPTKLIGGLLFIRNNRLKREFNALSYVIEVLRGSAKDDKL